MTFLVRNQILLAKIESTYGTDPTPVEGSNAIVIKNLQRTIYDGNRIQRDLVKPYMGNDHSINTAPFITVTFDVELAGASAAGVAPQYGELLRACALDETIVADTSVTYAPISTAMESLTLYYNYDGEMQKVIGAMGSYRISLTRGQNPMISFTFMGRYARPTAVPLYDPTFTAVAPSPFNSYNTTTFNVHAQAVVGESFTLESGNDVKHRNLAGFDGVLITDRNPTGNTLFEAVPIATKNFYAAAESHLGVLTEASISVVHGTVAGDICTITAPTAQLGPLSEQDSDGIRMYSADFIPIPTDSGNDEFTIAFT